MLVLHAADEYAAPEEYQVVGRVRPAAAVAAVPGVLVVDAWDAGHASIAAGLAPKDHRWLLRVEQEGGVLESQAEGVAARNTFI